MATEEKITLKEAIDLAAKHGIFISRPTAIKWARPKRDGGHGLGYQLGPRGRWVVYKNKWMELVRKGASK